MVACELTTQAGGRRLAAIAWCLAATHVLALYKRFCKARKPWRQPCKPRGCIASVRRAIFDAATLWALGAARQRSLLRSHPPWFILLPRGNRRSTNALQALHHRRRLRRGAPEGVAACWELSTACVVSGDVFWLKISGSGNEELLSCFSLFPVFWARPPLRGSC